MLNPFIKYSLKVVMLLIMFMNISHAGGGLALGATRLIYVQDKKQASLPIVNSSADKRFLINAWIEDQSSTKTKNIIVTPPMFVSEPKTENSLRIVNMDQNLAQDRETLYYIFVQAIPAANKEQLEQSNVLQLAIVSRIKMMIRPENLAIPVEDAMDLIKAKHSNNKITIQNPTPYFMTLVNLTIDNVKQDNLMLEPFSEKILNNSGHAISFQNINDYGAFSKVINISAQ